MDVKVIVQFKLACLYPLRDFPAPSGQQTGKRTGFFSYGSFTERRGEMQFEVEDIQQITRTALGLRNKELITEIGESLLSRLEASSESKTCFHFA